MNCIIFVKSGKLYLEDALLSLNFIVKSHKNVIPALVVNEGSEITMNRTEIKGNKHHETIGIIIKWADALIKDCKIHNHMKGGILIQSHFQNNIKIINTKVSFNTKVGIHCIGEDAVCQLEYNKIENNIGPGIKIGISNKANIQNNEIKLN